MLEEGRGYTLPDVLYLNRQVKLSEKLQNKLFMIICPGVRIRVLAQSQCEFSKATDYITGSVIST